MSDEPRTKKVYCPRGERWSNKTKKCEPKKVKAQTPTQELADTLLSFHPLQLSPKQKKESSPKEPKKEASPKEPKKEASPSEPKKRNYCPRGQRWNTKTKKCEPKEDLLKKREENKSIRKTKKLVIKPDIVIDVNTDKKSPKKPDESEEKEKVEKPKKKKLVIKKSAFVPPKEEEKESLVEEPGPELGPKPEPEPEPEHEPEPEPETEPLEESFVQISKSNDEPLQSFAPIIDTPPTQEITEEELPYMNEKEDELDSMFQSSKNMNSFLLEKERMEYLDTTAQEKYDFLYPTLNDPSFNIKITKKKEFNDTKYDGVIHDIEKQADILCNSDFELMPHQLFVKNFLSFQTPYNSLLLYHSLGTGKTCSAIGVAEEMRSYMKQVGLSQKILIVAKPNVQQNFRLQLFDERKLKMDNGIWNLNTCIGNVLLKEINPTSMAEISRDRIISQINTIINNNYKFIGYIGLANYIMNKIKVEGDVGTEAEKERIMIKRIKTFFSNRLIIIDEVHNIPTSTDNQKMKTASLLLEVAKHADNLRLLLLSATPMYNSYAEIIWLTNLMNSVDKRGLIKEKDVFDKNGNFKMGEVKKDVIIEGGRELLQRKLTGYVSYVRGENPYTFPYRIYPDTFSPENTAKSMGQQKRYPTIQMNKKPIGQDEILQHFPVFLTPNGEYQEQAYSSIIKNMLEKTYVMTTAQGQVREMPSFENMDSFGYTYLKEPLEALNIVYPSIDFNERLEGEPTEDIISDMIGKAGLSNTMTYKSVLGGQSLRYDFEYRPETEGAFGRFLSPSEIGKYSHKIAAICERIRNSTGIVLIYSQYIDGGAVPIALALEEMGFSRYGFSSHTRSLFKTPPVNPTGEKYVMITGDKAFSPNNLADIKYITSPGNKNGELVKVIIISKAAAEGVDFKNIRQVHIMEPWYNTNRIDQIIGRGVRNLSHCSLPFKSRNVEIYLHATSPRENSEEEPADLYVYRYAEKKAFQIGKVTRLLKETAVDCLLNIGQTNFTVKNLMALPENQKIRINLSSGGEDIEYQIGDKPFSDMCDFMEDCEFKCSPTQEIKKEEVIIDTYNDEFVKTNYATILKRIRQLYKENHVYTREQLINSINIVKEYPIEQIFYTLSQLVDNRNEYLIDQYGRPGYLTNKDVVYAFLPAEITDNNASIFERSVPIEYKREYMTMELPIEKVMNETTAPSTSRTYNDILLEIRASLEFANTKTEIEKKDTNWYKHAGQVMDIIQTTHQIPVENIEKYILYHILDTLSIDDKMLLVRKIYLPSFVKVLDVEQLIKDYFDMRLIDNKGRMGIVLSNNETWGIYTPSRGSTAESNVAVDTNDWVLTELSEKDEFIRAGLIRFIVRDVNFNQYVGFMHPFGKTENDIVFKIKNMKEKRNNKGAKCENAIKSDVINKLNILIDGTGATKTYTTENTSAILKPGLCVVMEILMRHYNDIQRDNKTWFLDTEKALINEITKK